jgi:hypothetical protein
MKNLIYPSALLFNLILITSCNKEELLRPVTPQIDTPVWASPACDSTQLVSYVITNSTNLNSLRVLFEGRGFYSFNIKANDSTTVFVKPGIYDIKIQATGNGANHSFHLHNYYLNDDVVLQSPGAVFKAIAIGACSPEGVISIQ